MTAEEHAKLIELYSQDKCLLGIDRAFSRRFYTDIPLSVIEQNTGERCYFEKGLVMLVFIGGWLAILGTFIFSVIVFKWWSLLLILAGALFWFVYMPMSSRGTARLWPVSIFLAVTIIVYLLDFLRDDVALVLLTFLLALWCARFVYVGSALFLRAFVVRNFRAFNFVSELAGDNMVVRYPEEQ